jgi:CDP-diacylglycerol---glycerol-3-phosphate 3-phosphatidyltransferase
MANFITLLRMGLVFIVVAIALYANPVWQLINPFLIVFIMLLDALDGIIARARNEASLFGAVFDIAADRFIEIAVWTLLAKINLVSTWIPLIFLFRGVLVDGLRYEHAGKGIAPFNIMQSKLGKFLVASRFMRFFYGTIKLVAFSWLLFMQPAPLVFSMFYKHYAFTLQIISNVLIYITLITCLVRGIPVLYEKTCFYRS